MAATRNTSVTEGTISIPSYEMGPRNPLPYLKSDREIYPYEAHGYEYRTARPRRRRYRRVTLENRYLRVTILPELGGRVHSLVDKTNGDRNVLYTDEARLIRGGIGHNYIGMGLEMNFPDAHAITNVRPRNYRISQPPDGAVSATIWEIEWIGRNQWAYTFTLHPNRAALEVSVEIFNPTFWPRRMRYWANAATPSDDTTEFIFPEEHADMHGGGHNYFQWPNYLGMDLSRFKNHEDVLGLYYLMVRDGFLGYYNHEPGFGLVHAADPSEVPGKKLWTWGKSQMGRSRTWFYGGPYSEVQSGRVENQDHFDWVQPGKSFRWVEHWYPIKQMDGFRWANTEVAAQFKSVDDGLQVQLHATRKYEHAEVRLTRGTKIIAHAEARLDPAHTWDSILPVSDEFSSSPDLTLSVVDLLNDGCVIASFAPFRTPLSADEIVRMGHSVTDNQGERNAETLTLRADWFGREGKWTLVEKLLNDALTRDPGYSPAHCRLGMLHMRRGDFDAARAHLEKALARNEFDTQALAWLAEICLQEERFPEAESLFLRAARHGDEPFGYAGAARIRMRQGNPAAALDLYVRAREYNTRNLRTAVGHAVALRKAGDLKGASASIADTLKICPTDPIARFEETQIARQSRTSNAKAKLKTLRDSIQATLPEQYWLEIAYFYLDLGGVAEAIEAARIASQCRKTSGETNPLCHYLLAWLRTCNRESAASVNREYKHAKACSLDYAWPSRLEEAVLLNHLIAVCPKDGRLPYLLGTLCFAWGDVERGLELWRRARKLGLRYAGLDRNLGFAEITVQKNPDRALAHYRRAVRQRPDEVHLHVELCDVLARLGRKDAICRHLEKHFDMTHRSQTLAARLAGTYATLGRPEKVLSAQARFHLEGWDYTQERLRQDACVAIAEACLNARRHEEALRILEQAWELPPNLGSGEVTCDRTYARELYLMGVACEGMGEPNLARQKWEESVAERHKALYRTINDEFRMWFARYWQAKALKKLGRAEEANTYLDGLIEFSKFIDNSSGTKISAGMLRRLRQYAAEARTVERRVLAGAVGEAAEA